MNAGDVSAQVHDLGRKADESTTLDHGVRVGIVAYAIMHLLIAWVALQLAFGDRQGTADSQGALSQLAQTPLGGLLLYVVAGGFTALVLWQGAEVLAGHRESHGAKRLGKRVVSAAKLAVYAFLGWSALKIAVGGGSDGDQTDTITAKVMIVPGGQVIVAVAGLTVLGIGLALIYRGLSEGFMDKLQAKGQFGRTGKAFVALGKTGHVAKGLAFMAVAGLFLWAAWTHDPQKSGGLDQALHKVLQQPFGTPMLVALGVGIACYGLFAFAWARHLDR